MPGWLQPIAEHNPFTIVTNAGRALYNGRDPGSDLWIALAWAVGITIVFATLSVRKYTLDHQPLRSVGPGGPGPPPGPVTTVGSNPCSTPSLRIGAGDRPRPVALWLRRGAARRASGWSRVAYGVIRTPPDTTAARAAGHARRPSSTRCSTRSGRAALAVERVLFQVNARTAIVGRPGERARARGRRRARGIPVAHYSPNEVKLAVDRATARADKAQVQAMVTRLLQPRRRRRARPTPPTRSRSRSATCGPRRCAAGRRGDAGAAARRCHRASTAPSPRPLAKEDATMIGSVRGIGARADRDRRGARRGRGRRLPRARAARRAADARARATPAFLFTHLHVREDAMVLYGFPTRDERDTFEVLIGATGRRPEARARDPVGALARGAAARAARGRPRRAHARARASASAPRSGCWSS